MLDEMKEPLSEKNIELNYDENALKAIAEKSHGKTDGARDIRRVIRQNIEDKIANIIIEHASEIKEKFRVFLEDTLHLEMSEKKTKITHSQDKARFLGYDITTAKNSALMQSSGHTEMPIQAVGQEQPVPDDKGASGNMDYTEEDVKKYQMDPDINELLDFSFCGE